MAKKLLLITGNPDKAKEFEKLLDLENLAFRSLPIPEIQSMDIEEVAKAKAKTALGFHSETEGYDAIITDDSGIALTGLGGLPGPLTKWFLDCLKMEDMVNMIQEKSKEAFAQCVLSLGMVATGEILLFRGEVKGSVVPPIGANGFGWDQIFVPEGETKTYAQIPMETKNQISHRSLAAQKLKQWLHENL